MSGVSFPFAMGPVLRAKEALFTICFGQFFPTTFRLWHYVSFLEGHDSPLRPEGVNARVLALLGPRLFPLFFRRPHLRRSFSCLLDAQSALSPPFPVFFPFLQPKYFGALPQCTVVCRSRFLLISLFSFLIFSSLSESAASPSSPLSPTARPHLRGTEICPPFFLRFFLADFGDVLLPDIKHRTWAIVYARRYPLSTGPQ